MAEEAMEAMTYMAQAVKKEAKNKKTKNGWQRQKGH